jgi:hypothetical protein
MVFKKVQEKSNSALYLFLSLKAVISSYFNAEELACDDIFRILCQIKRLYLSRNQEILWRILANLMTRLVRIYVCLFFENYWVVNPHIKLAPEKFH